MADNYKEYLAARVLTEGQPVTYRLLSRALTVNVNTAKQMLYDFYTTQNAKTPKSLHATYLLTGRKPAVEDSDSEDDEDGGRWDDKPDKADPVDIIMGSSPPYMSSMPDAEDEEPEEDEAVLETSVELVREEDLESTKAEFYEITSIHMYSLEPGPIEDLRLLTVCNLEIAKDYSNDDALDRWRLYGSIHCPHIKRREHKAGYPPATAPEKPAAKAAVKPSVTAPKASESKPALARQGSGPEKTTSGRSTPQPTSAAGTLKREKSNIFNSFAKAKAKPKEPAKSKASTPAPGEDEPMQGMSEDEGGEDDVPQVQFDEVKAAQARKARTEREERLKRMMEESDEEMPDVSPTEEKESQEPIQEDVPAKAEPQPTVTSEGGRRRGRRKIMKKKRVKDEEGYMVTIEEPAWESFSEAEPEPKKLKPTPKPTTAKKTGKMGQGSIANFFKKA